MSPELRAKIDKAGREIAREITHELAQPVIRPQPKRPLTDRERPIVEHVLRGLSRNEAAAILGVSLSAVAGAISSARAAGHYIPKRNHAQPVRWKGR